MKATAIPAQITTVEDKVAGNLTLSQLALLGAPIFFGGCIFSVLPPTMTLSGYKIALTILATIICCALAIRIKDRIVLRWLIMIGGYNLRPRYHIFNKNCSNLRNISRVPIAPEQNEYKEVIAEPAAPPLVKVSPVDLIRTEQLIANPKANVEFKARKGGLYVHVTEVE